MVTVARLTFIALLLVCFAGMSNADVLLSDDFTGTTIDPAKWSTYQNQDSGSMTQNDEIQWDHGTENPSPNWTGHGLRTVQIFETGGVYTIEADYSISDLLLSQGESATGLYITREEPAREPSYYGSPLHAIAIDFRGKIVHVGDNFYQYDSLNTKNILEGLTKPTGYAQGINYFLSQNTVHLRIEIDTEARTIRCWADGLMETYCEAAFTQEVWDDVTGGTNMFRLEEFRAWAHPIERYAEHTLDNWSVTRLFGTVDCSMACEPYWGTVPFTTNMSVSITNVYMGQIRRIAGRIDVSLAGGNFYGSWRAGYTNLAPGNSYTASWPQTIPALASVIGDNIFALTAVDVTPAPYNQPPYPAAGDTVTSACVVTGVLP